MITRFQLLGYFLSFCVVYIDLFVGNQIVTTQKARVAIWLPAYLVLVLLAFDSIGQLSNRKR